MEALAGGASIISVVSLAIQINDSVKKLRTFFHALKDAPHDVQRIANRLATISAVLRRLEQSPNATSNDPDVRLALLDCQACINEVSAIAQELGLALQSADWKFRARSLLKSVDKVKLMEKLEDRLEKAKSTLMLALQILGLQSAPSEMQLVQHAMQESALSDGSEDTNRAQRDSKLLESPLEDHPQACRQEIAAFLSDVNPWIKPGLAHALNKYLDQSLQSLQEQTVTGDIAPLESVIVKASRRQRCIAQSETCHRTIFGAILFKSRLLVESVTVSEDEADGFESHKALSQWRFIPSQWLFRLGFARILNLTISGSDHSGWKFASNLPRIVPDDSILFDYCESGDLMGVRQLFLQRQASVVDVDSQGYTALHIAAINHDYRLCEFLIACEADVNAETYEDMASPFMLACIEHEFIGQDAEKSECGSRQVQTFRALLTAGFDLEEEWHVQSSIWMALMHGSTAAERRGYLPQFEMPSKWILKHLSLHALHGLSQYPQSLWKFLFQFALTHCQFTNSVTEVLPYFQPDTVRDALVQSCSDDFPLHLSDTQGSTQNLRQVLEKSGGLNFTCLLDAQITTPTRQAMTNLLSFRSFKRILCALEVDLETFASDEAPLVPDGWSSEALLTLFRSNEPPNPTAGVYCKYCRKSYSSIQKNDPIWDQHRERIRIGLDPEGPFSDEELELRAHWHRAWRIYMESGICPLCQDEFRMEADEEIECHPGLLDINL